MIAVKLVSLKYSYLFSLTFIKHNNFYGDKLFIMLIWAFHFWNTPFVSLFRHINRLLLMNYNLHLRTLCNLISICEQYRCWTKVETREGNNNTVPFLQTVRDCKEPTACQLAMKGKNVQSCHPGIDGVS